MSKNFPILEAAASHIEINGQMHELPVYLKHKDYQMYSAIFNRETLLYVGINAVECYAFPNEIIVKGSLENHEPCTKKEFDRAFQDTFFHRAQISEGKL